jgi:hypothetical protein
MTTYDTRKTADYSPLLVHFTKGRRMVMEELIEEGHALFGHRASTARDKLVSILELRTIHASPMPFLPNNPPAVCFTECVWEALIGHAEQYSPYGVVFSKRLIFESGGGPALYVRGDSLRAIGDEVPLSLEPLIAPFDPEALLEAGVRLDWLHEREWRLPGSLTFEYSDVEYVIVDSIEDARQVVYQIGAQRLPEEKLIPMEVYRTIQRAWSGR